MNRHHRAKLFPEQVRLIRRLHQKGVSQGRLARQFKVSVPTIGQVVQGATWRHVGTK